MESLLWASDCFSRSATTVANDGWLPLHKILCGSYPLLSLLLFPRRPTTECLENERQHPVPASVHFVNFGYNHSGDCYKLQHAGSGKVVIGRDVTWRHPEATLIPPANSVGIPPAATPEDIHVPMPTPVPIVTAPSPTTTPTPVPTPAPTSTSTMPPPLTTRKPRLQSPRALVANCSTKDMRRCPGGLVAKPEQCSKHRGRMLTTTNYC